MTVLSNFQQLNFCFNYEHREHFHTAKPVLSGESGSTPGGGKSMRRSCSESRRQRGGRRICRPMPVVPLLQLPALESLSP